MSMREFITLLAASTALFFIGWFVSFSLDPYRVCIDHPDKNKRDEFFLCKPFDFELHKDTLLRRTDSMPWEKDGTFFDGSRKRKKKKVEITPLQRCINETRMQDPQNLLGLNVEQHCRNLIDDVESNELSPSNQMIKDQERVRPLEGSRDL